MKSPLLLLTVLLLALPAGAQRAARGHPRGLTHAQIHDLQAALQREGCDPGGIDGRMGPQTRRAIACARQAKGLAGNNANDLLRALDLSFTVADSMGTGGIMRSARPSGMRGDPPQDMSHGGIIGRDSAVAFDTSQGKGGRGRVFKRRPQGRDTLPPGRTPR